MANKPNALQSMGLASCTALTAINFTHPIDLCKTRMQVGNFSLGSLIRNEGVLSLWKGIKAAYVREVFYTSVKLGGYGPLKQALGATDANSPFYLKFFAGALSGSIGSVFGNPFDVMKTIGMTNQGNKSVPLSKLMQQMYSEQGISGFYRGLSANVSRACVLNGTKMACYDQIKGMVVDSTGWARKDIQCQFTSAACSGFFMACTVSPFDMLRTTLMNQPVDKKVYKGFADAAIKIMRNEGPFAFYRGFFAIWGRFAPQATLQLVIFDNMLQLCGFDPL